MFALDVDDNSCDDNGDENDGDDLMKMVVVFDASNGGLMHPAWSIRAQRHQVATHRYSVDTTIVGFGFGKP